MINNIDIVLCSQCFHVLILDALHHAAGLLLVWCWRKLYLYFCHLWFIVLFIGAECLGNPSKKVWKIGGGSGPGHFPLFFKKKLCLKCILSHFRLCFWTFFWKRIENFPHLPVRGGGQTLVWNLPHFFLTGSLNVLSFILCCLVCVREQGDWPSQ